MGTCCLNMVGETPLVLASQAIATITTNLWVGSSPYISLTEIPARRSLATVEAKLKNWQTIWPLAGRQIGILGGISLVSSVFSWFKETNEDHAFLLLVNLGVLAGLMVWTLGLILPINLQLNDGTNALKKGESNVESLLAKWAPLHHVRTLGGLVCMACLTAYWMKKAATALRMSYFT